MVPTPIFATNALPKQILGVVKSLPSEACNHRWTQEITQWVCPANAIAPNSRPTAQIEMLRGFEGTSVSSSQLTNMLCSPHNHRLAASLAYLVRADPFPLDRPCAKTLVVRVIPGEVAMLDESPTRVTTLEVDDLELAVCQYESW